MKNIVELRNGLTSVFKDLRKEKIDHKHAKELNNCAGKIISSCKVEIEYFVSRDEKPNIPFLGASA